MTAQAFFDDLRTRIPETAHAASAIVGGLPVMFRSSNKALLEPFAHLPPAWGPMSLTLHAWDSGTPNWDSTRQDVQSLVSDRYQAVFEGDRFYGFDRKTKEGFFWMPSIDRLDALERSTPFRPILHWWALQHGMQLTHAAAIGYPDAGALIVGPGGAGKSTTALACIQDGMDYVGDDYCLLDCTEDGWSAWSVYGSAKLDNVSLGKMPDFHVVERDAGPKHKNLLSLRRTHAEQLSPDLPLRVILVPQVVPGGVTRAFPVSPAVALAAVAPSTLFQLPGARAETFRRLSALVNQVPCYRLILGRYLNETPEVIGSLLESLS